ncbi:MAG: MFS transporter, partial [Thermoleophilia bacterium]
LATLASDRTDAQLASGEPAAAALNAGYHLAYLVGAGAIAVALVVAVTVLRTPAAAEVFHPAEFEPDEDDERYLQAA